MLNPNRKTIFLIVLFFLVLIVGIPKVGHSQTENESAQKVLTFFYPDTHPSKITARLKALAQKMAADAVEKSGWIDKVPRPSGWKPGLGYLVKAGYEVFKAGANKKIYEAVRATLARNFRTEYELLLIDAEIN